MFGWEFPPHNSGGLGTACYGLTKSLSKQGIDVTFVLPRKMNVKADFLKFVFGPKKAHYLINSLLQGYSTQESYQTRLFSSNEGEKESQYGMNLKDEVLRYGRDWK